MMTMMKPVTACGLLLDNNSTGHVSPNLLRGMAECGYPAPLRSLMDARIDYPEILLCSGWERESTLDGVIYTYQADCEDARQSIEYGPGTTRTLRTSCYGLTQVLVRHPDGRMEEWYE
jgi:hypothetical protein